VQVIDVIKRLLPDGTTPALAPQWRRPPFWPPDLFAVTATLATMSGCYTRPRYTAHWQPGCFFRDSYLERVRKAGRIWRQEKRIPAVVRQLWTNIISNGRSPVVDPSAPWCDAAMTLMAIADEASVGVGFVVKSGTTIFADYLLRIYRNDFVGRKRVRRTHGPKLPLSLCWMVPPSEVCVQPKSRTPQVGLTLRSLTHHLALLPGEGEISTNWLFAPHDDLGTDKTLNILTIPFPYRLDGSCFVAETDGYGDGDSRYFSMSPKWLRHSGRLISTRELSRFIIRLIERARREVSEVHAVVLPELALDRRLAGQLARSLARVSGLELFVSGTVQAKRGRTGLSQNEVYTAIFHRGRVITAWQQAKHHRWQLNESQIRRYHLGDALDPRKLWWEQIEIQPRKCAFYVFRDGATMTSLVCEDLARIDPVQVALRAVGPNLVVVLLLDGPQLERRWPGRYATVLADDPGSAVLTLTSLGMVRRSVMPGQPEPREIALWKDPSGEARELRLPVGAQALLLTITQHPETNFCLDGRGDDEMTIGLTLSGVHEVTLDKPPAWI
jgi:hypothetical protein